MIYKHRISRHCDGLFYLMQRTNTHISTANRNDNTFHQIQPFH